MSKPYSEADFSSQIQGDRTWRIKELSDLKTAARRADGNLQRALLRALVTVCYAHFEGSVRFSARKYLEYVAMRKLKFREIDRQFLRNYFLPRLAALSNATVNISQRCTLVDEILNSSNLRFSRFDKDLVNTKANLSFEVFQDICKVCGVSIATFEGKATFVDVFLLKRRNSIAHGEDTYVEVADLDDLASGTIELMRTFGDALENHIYSKSYKSA